MLIGVPTEIKSMEFRVGMTTGSVAELKFDRSVRGSLRGAEDARKGDPRTGFAVKHTWVEGA